MKRFLSFFLVSLMMLGLLAACGGSTATNTPAATGNTAVPATTAPVEPTKAGDTATTPPASGSELPKINGEVTLWHSYSTGGAEDATLTKIVETIKTNNPDAKITVLQVPFDQIFTKFETDVSAGGGPDLLVAPNDSLGDLSRKGLLLDITSMFAPYAANYSPAAIEGLTVDGKLYGIPESFKAVALYYNKDKVKTPPATTDELLAAVKGGNTITLNLSAYHNFGFFSAFGAKVLDGNKCALTTGGADALKYLQDLKAAGGQFGTDGGQIDSLFKEGKIDMTINGPWAFGDYKKALGDKLGVAVMPKGPKGAAGPLTGVDGFYVNANSQNVDNALAFGLQLTDATSQQLYADEAGHVPAYKGVTPKDALVLEFVKASEGGVLRPQSKEFGNYWGPFGEAFTKAIDGNGDATQLVTDACKAMDTASGQ